MEQTLLMYLHQKGIRFSQIGEYFAIVDPIGVYFKPYVNVSQKAEQAYMCRLDMKVFLPGGDSFIESYVGQGRTSEGAIQQSAQFYIQFCHSLLVKAFGSGLNGDLVHVFNRKIHGISYACYTAGPRIMAAPSNPNVPVGDDLIAVAEEFKLSVDAVIDSLPVSGRYHSYRALAARVNDQPTSEFLKDGEPVGDHHQMFINLRKVEHAGYTNFRYFELMVRSDLQTQKTTAKKEPETKKFFGLFSKKAEESSNLETNTKRLRTVEECAQMAIEIMTTNGLGKDGHQLEQLMLSVGISSDYAEKLHVFLPIVAMRFCYPGFEWPEQYMLAYSDGIQETKRFTDNEFYMRLKEYFDTWAAKIDVGPLPLVMATRSAEYNIMNQMMNEQVPMNASTFASLMIALPYD
ncbi:MAG: hypothetical protein IPP69_03650 [Flavobacteriales bacterium]|nr:hypothetical protein [Flavobacteriales bacterium]